MVKVTFLSFCLSVFIFLKSSGQEKYRVAQWNVEQGLSMSNCFAMIKDTAGFLWVATQVGLNRFDGGSFRTYFPEKNKGGTIAGSRIDGLLEDSLHNIWVGTDRGLSRYDIKADTFRNFYPEVVTGGANTFIIPFSSTRDEIYCLEPEFIITAYNVHSFKKRTLTKQFYADVGDDFVRPSYSILVESTGTVWLIDGDGLLEITLSDHKLTHYSLPVNKNHLVTTHQVQGMCYDRRRRCIWLSTTEGLLQLTPADKKFHQVKALDDLEHENGFDMHPSIHVDPQGKIWFCTNQNGIMAYDPFNESIVPAFNDSVTQHTVSEGSYNIYCDKEGIVWDGTFSRQGIYQLIPFSQSVFHFKAQPAGPSVPGNAIINCIQPGPLGTVWIGTNWGLVVFNPKTNAYSVFKKKDMPGISSDLIYGLSIDTSRKKAFLIVADKRSLFEMDVTTKQCLEIICKDSSNSNIDANGISYFVESKHGLYVRLHNRGIYALNFDSSFGRQIISLPHQKITRIVSIEDSLIFLRLFGTSGNITYTNKKGTWVRTLCPLDTVIWNNVWYDSRDKTFWAGGRHLLLHFDRNFKLLHDYEGEVSDIDITSIIGDNNGNVWISGPSNIAVLNIKTGKVIFLAEKDGLQKQQYNWSTPHTKDGNGNIYFASIDEGFDKIEPGKFVSNYSGVKVYLKSLDINHQPYSAQGGINDVTELHLKYFENNISIQAGVIDYYAKGEGNNRIRYKIERVDRDWQYAPANYIIRYGGLSPGNYKLILQASNAVNEWNGPIKVVSINISPAFWNTWWFRFLFALAVVAVIYGLFRYRINQLRKLLLLRTKISRDLHDEIGSTLSSINILSKVSKTNLDKDVGKTSELLQKITEQSADIQQSMSDIVWSIRPENDKMESLIIRMREYLGRTAEPKNMKVNFVANEKTLNTNLPMQHRRDIFLIFKEAVNNAVKYSEGKSITIFFGRENNHIRLSVKDDGVGFHNAEMTPTNGLKNMQTRAKEINGILQIKSEPGTGTEIELICLTT